MGNLRHSSAPFLTRADGKCRNLDVDRVHEEESATLSTTTLEES